MTRTSQSPSTLGPSSQARVPEAGTAVVPARSMTKPLREGPSVAEKAAASTCLPPNAQLLDRIRGECLEMPGLKLTLPQAQRLWHLRERECEGLLGALIHAKFLSRKSDGRYARVSELGASAGIRAWRRLNWTRGFIERGAKPQADAPTCGRAFSRVSMTALSEYCAVWIVRASF